MTTNGELRKSVAFVSMLLGNFAAWWGFFVLPIYAVGFMMLLPYSQAGAAAPLAGAFLPLELPLIGLALAVVSLITSLAEGGRRISVPAVLGLVLNALPMVLALVLWHQRAQG
jgi:hypothetical protein